VLFRSNAFVCNSEGACEVPIVGPYMIATFVIIGFVILVFIIVISVVASKNKKNRQKRKNREAAKSERKIEMQPLRAAEQQAGTLEFFEALHIYCVLHSALI
jgi:predicted membrane protein